MKNTSIFAKLLPENKIRITIMSSLMKAENVPINLIKNDGDAVVLKIEKTSMLGNVAIYECSSPLLIELGNRYLISIESFGSCALDVNDSPFYDGFDEKYYYSGNDLGATYDKDHTTFVVWAPLAASVLLKISNDCGKSFVFYEMSREPKGTFRIILNGNYDGAIYNYAVENSGVTRLTTDPYGIGSTANGLNSVVINPKRTHIDLEENDLPFYKNYVDTIIYETGVRDFTISSFTNIEHKGKFLGLSEEKRTTKGGNPAGLDYLKFLGITHLQLMPIYDFKTVDEENAETTYNWGYDPQQYFVPEGSFASDVNDPYSRILDLKKMVKALHHNKIKVNMDVVFNHVYNYQTSVFEALVPNYYFRRNNNGTMSNGSFCGDDFETQHRMVSKLIIDCALYWIKEYGIDGFRFDLMGIIDKYTIMKIYREAIKIKADFMIYGEGWNMPTNLPEEAKSSMNNAKSLPHIGFFNDAFRDITKGPTSESEFHVSGYLTGDFSYRDGFKFVFLGSCLPRTYNNKFLTANQSINYVECHDNGTLYDKIVACSNLEEEKDILRIVKLVNSCVLFSYGVPFIHMGQEIGQSKNMHQNTYRSGDKYNMFQYDLLDKRFDMAQYMSSIIELRKNAYFLHEYSSDVIQKAGEFIELDEGALGCIYNKCSTSQGEKTVLAFINPTNETVYYDADYECEQYLGDCGFIRKNRYISRHLTIPPRSYYTFIKVD
jgi:pullulanase